MKVKKIIVFFSVFTVYHGCNSINMQGATRIFQENIDSLFLQPNESYMGFIDDLKSPMWTKHNWVGVPPQFEHANLRGGFILKKEFPDNDALLETTYNDFELFLKAGEVDINPNDLGWIIFN